MADTYEYRIINISLEPLKQDGDPPTVVDVANRWAKQGWRTVGIIQGPSYPYAILIERKRKYLGIAFEDDKGKHVLHPDDVTFIYGVNE